MATADQNPSSGYLFAKGSADSYLEHAQSLVDKPQSGVHFVFPLLGAWDSMTVLDAPLGDLRALRALVTNLTWSPEQGNRVLSSTLAIPLSAGRIKKLERLHSIETIVGIRTQAGAAQIVFEELESGLGPPPGTGVLPERVNGSYDLVCELWADELESMQEVLEHLRDAVGDRGAVDVSYASFA